MAFYTPQKQMSFSRELRMVLQERNLFSAKSREKVCSMLNDSAIASSTPIEKVTEKGEKQRDYRRQAVLEILTSEQTYLAQLEMLMKYFVLPLKEKAIINVSSHRLLFGQIELIYNLNLEFLRTLENDIEKVAYAFVTMAPFFKLYSTYAFDYGKALLVLQDLTNKNLTFRKFLEETESRPEVQRKLMSLLIVPIQRIPRYKLLLQQVSFYTSPSDPDLNLLRESIKQIEDTANHINSCVQDQEVTQALINLQNSLYNRVPNIVKPARKIIKEGVLQKVTHNGTEIKRYCILMSDIFMYCKILKERVCNTHVENSLECCCIFPLNKCKVYELLPGNFKITCQGDGLIFSTRDLRLQKEWVATLQDAIEVHLQCRKTLRKESSKRTPLRKKAAKNFGTDYVLSPKAKRGEYDTVFRSVNHSSDDSEDSTNGRTKKNKCFPFNRWHSDKETKMFGRRRKEDCLKRRASSPSVLRTKFMTSQQKYEQRFSLENFPCLPAPTIHITPTNGILKPKPLKNHLESSYGFGTNTYFCTSNIDNTFPIPSKYNEALFQQVRKNAINLQDELTLSPPLKKRVKFDESHNNMLTDNIDIREHDFYGNITYSTTTTTDDNCIPLHRKIWKFITGFF